jgi:hypothetical protein
VSLFPRLDILPSAQRNLWPELATVSRHSFVLYGGTAVALYLGHRDEALHDLPSHLEERLLSAIKSVRSIPAAVLDSTTLND